MNTQLFAHLFRRVLQLNGVRCTHQRYHIYLMPDRLREIITYTNNIVQPTYCMGCMAEDKVEREIYFYGVINATQNCRSTLTVKQLSDEKKCVDCRKIFNAIILLLLFLRFSYKILKRYYQKHKIKKKIRSSEKKTNNNYQPIFMFVFLPSTRFEKR